MIDNASRYLTESPVFNSLSEDCICYFDFEAYEQYLDDDEILDETDHGIYEMRKRGIIFCTFYYCRNES